MFFLIQWQCLAWCNGLSKATCERSNDTKFQSSLKAAKYNLLKILVNVFVLVFSWQFNRVIPLTEGCNDMFINCKRGGRASGDIYEKRGNSIWVSASWCPFQEWPVHLKSNFSHIFTKILDNTKHYQLNNSQFKVLL